MLLLIRLDNVLLTKTNVNYIPWPPKTRLRNVAMTLLVLKFYFCHNRVVTAITQLLVGHKIAIKLAAKTTLQLNYNYLTP